MRPGALRAAIEEDEREGIRPVAVCAVAGTTSTTSFDPLEEIAEICRDSGIWLHVDAAYAGPAAIARSFVHFLPGGSTPIPSW